LSEEEILDIINKAFPTESVETNNAPVKKKSKVKEQKKETEEDGWADEEDTFIDYSEYSAKELYKMCKNRGIDVKPKKKKDFYIKKLEEDDDDLIISEEDDWE
jgi:hypothetical protein